MYVYIVWIIATYLLTDGLQIGSVDITREMSQRLGSNLKSWNMDCKVERV